MTRQGPTYQLSERELADCDEKKSQEELDRLEAIEREKEIKIEVFKENHPLNGGIVGY